MDKIELYMDSINSLVAEMQMIAEKYQNDTEEAQLHYMKKAMQYWFKVNGNLRI